MGVEPSSEHYIEKQETETVSDEYTTMEFRKIFTPAGERLEIEAPEIGRSIRLDAMELESLSWQDQETFLSFLDTDLAGLLDDIPARKEFIRRHAEGPADDGTVTREVRVTNEFADALVRSRETDACDRVDIEAPKLGYRTSLTPTELQTTTWQTTETFTELLEDPFGPGDH